LRISNFALLPEQYFSLNNFTALRCSGVAKMIKQKGRSQTHTHTHTFYTYSTLAGLRSRKEMIKLREMIINIATSRNSLLQICASLCLQRPKEETRETMGAREIDRESERDGGRERTPGCE
jgi:hypothetical protein